MNSNKLFFLALLLAVACSSNDVQNSQDNTFQVKGYAQKGPYLTGADVTIAELDEKLIPTGKTFLATTLDDNGYFEVPNVKLKSKYALVKVNGDYFNEAHNQASFKELTLYSIVDFSNGGDANINLLTHLQKARIENLVQNGGKSVKDAKAQAYRELLAVFSWDSYTTSQPEKIGLFDSNAGGGILLSVSSIFSQIVNEYASSEYAAWLKMITDFQTDFADNGVLDATQMGNKLVSAAATLNFSDIKKNLNTQFPDNTVPDFDVYINHFIQNSHFTNYFTGLFPEGSGGAVNILSLPDSAVLQPGTNYVFKIEPPAADIPISINFDVEKMTNNANSSFAIDGTFWSMQDQFSYSLIMTADNKQSIDVPVTFSGTGEIVIMAPGVIADGVFLAFPKQQKRIYW